MGSLSGVPGLGVFVAVVVAVPCWKSIAATQQTRGNSTSYRKGSQGPSDLSQCGRCWKRIRRAQDIEAKRERDKG